MERLLVTVRTLTAFLALATCLLATTGVASAEVEYPDLVPEAADHPEFSPLQPAHDSDHGLLDPPRMLLRFNGYIRNIGAGPLELIGSSPFGPLDNRLMQNHDQVVYDDPDDGDDGCTGDGMGNGGVPEDRCTGAWAGPGDRRPAAASSAELRFETNDTHRHWHFMQAARYTLYDASRTTLVAPARKVGFCLVDHERTDGTGPPNKDADGSPIEGPYSGHDNCMEDTDADPSDGPNAESLTMGISSGWKDTYEWNLAFQWVDVSEVQPGNYWLLSEVDPLNVIDEGPAGEGNNGGLWAQALVPGYLARDVAGATTVGAATPLTLSSTQFGTPQGSVEYRIVEAPDHGSLNRDTAEWFDGSGVVYTPHTGYQGADSFRFEARDASQPDFPVSPAAAVATVEVTEDGEQDGGQTGGQPGGQTGGHTGDPDGPTLVQISGAPGSMFAGTSARLHAIVKGYRSARVTWTASSGRISRSGLYTAPRRVPAGRSARVTATAGDGTRSQVTIRIAKPRNTPAPDLPTPGGKGPLSRLAVGKHGRLLVVKFVARRTGRVGIKVVRKRRKVASCRVRAPKRVPVTCRMRLPRRLANTRKGRLGVRATLKVRGHVVARRSKRLAPARLKAVSTRANASGLQVEHDHHDHHH